MKGPDPPQRRPWFDRQGIIQAHAGFVVALIALLQLLLSSDIENRATGDIEM